MATDIAANSDSTFMNSHGVSWPDFTIADSPSTMWVCGEIGYAQITSGRHRATASATARDPSVCLSMGGLQVICRRRGRDVAIGDTGGEAAADRALDRRQRDDPGERGERAEQRRVRHRPSHVLARELARRDASDPVASLTVRKLLELARGVDQQVTVVAQPAEEVDLMQQRRVLHDQAVGTHDRLAR